MNIHVTKSINPLATVAVKFVRIRTITFQLSQIKRQDFKETMIVTIDNYLKFLHPIQQQENPIREELYNVFCSKIRNACSQRPGK